MPGLLSIVFSKDHRMHAALFNTRYFSRSNQCDGILFHSLDPHVGFASLAISRQYDVLLLRADLTSSHSR